PTHTLSLHDALPIFGFTVDDVERIVGLTARQDVAEDATVSVARRRLDVFGAPPGPQPLQRCHRCSATSSRSRPTKSSTATPRSRSEEHTSELQSLAY